MRPLEADYVIVGAGAVGLAFADTLLDDTDASMIIVDRNAKPGGHWNGAYPFIRLHSPSLAYGVNSRELDGGSLDERGFNRGFHQLARGADIRAYFDAVMHERLLPSGRVTYFPQHDYADGAATSLIDGARRPLIARRKLVDATFAATQLPTTQPPSFSVAAGVNLIAPHHLDRVTPGARYTIIGAGKTAMDTVVWLLEHGAPSEAITWIRPRDAWLLPRANMQPSYAYFASTIGALALEMEAARDADSIPDLFDRLEACGVLKRLDPNVTPSMYRCAIVSDAEIELMRSVTNVVRMGHVAALEPERIVLEHGAIPAAPDQIHINCSADGIPRRAPEPIFQDDLIRLQYVRRCSPTFSAAAVAHIEATHAGDDAKNRLATPVPPPDEPLDWLRMHLAEASNRLHWSRSAEMQPWLYASRLDRFTAMIMQSLQHGDPEHAAILNRYRDATKPGLIRLKALLAASGQ